MNFIRKDFFLWKINTLFSNKVLILVTIAPYKANSCRGHVAIVYQSNFWRLRMDSVHEYVLLCLPMNLGSFVCFCDALVEKQNSTLSISALLKNALLSGKTYAKVNF